MSLPSLHLLESSKELKMVLAVYKGNGTYKDHIEYHPVQDGIIQSARQFSYDFLRETMEGYKVIRKPRKKKEIVKIMGAIPEELLYLNTDDHLQLIFYDKPEKRKLLFDNNNNKLKTKEYNVPGVIYMQNNKTLYLFAYEELKGAETKLYHPRLPNIGKGCSMCTGSVKRKSMVDVRDQMNEIRSTVWESNWAEWHHDNSESMWKRNKFVFSKKYFKGTLKDVAHETFRTDSIYD